MANRIKGITVEIGGDTTGLDKSLRQVNSTIRSAEQSLRDVNRLLKLDPTNTQLLAQKQDLLQKEISETQTKLNALKEVDKQAKVRLLLQTTCLLCLVAHHVPVPNNLLIQNLEDETVLAERIDGEAIDFSEYNPTRAILDTLRLKPEIDYEKCSTLLFKLISEVTEHYSSKYGRDGMCNIVMLNKQDIADKIYQQMMQDNHVYRENSAIRFEVIRVSACNRASNYGSFPIINLYENEYTNIKNVIFNGIRKAVFSSAKFDSLPELILARVLESDADVLKWLRPDSKEFNIVYNHGRHYVPDFVVETEQYFDLVEVKGEDKLTNPDVLAKRACAVKFCNAASEWAHKHDTKPWRYVFIPSKKILISSSYNTLAERFVSL